MPPPAAASAAARASVPPPTAELRSSRERTLTPLSSAPSSRAESGSEVCGRGTLKRDSRERKRARSSAASALGPLFLFVVEVEEDFLILPLKGVRWKWNATDDVEKKKYHPVANEGYRAPREPTCPCFLPCSHSTRHGLPVFQFEKVQKKSGRKSARARAMCVSNVSTPTRRRGRRGFFSMPSLSHPSLCARSRPR